MNSKLDLLVGLLNKCSRNKYGIYSAYGCYQLVQYLNNQDTRKGIHVITPLVSRKMLITILSSLLNYLNSES